MRSATKVTADVIHAGKRLRVIARAGVGVDNIDVEAATQAGVIVVNAPTGNVVAAAEHTVAMLMAVARNLAQANAHVHEGQWKRDRFMGVEVRDKTLGTVGLGRVAQEVVRRAQGLGMNVMAYDPYVTAEYALQRGVTLTDLDTLVAQADFITLHVPLTPQTRHLIGRERLAPHEADRTPHQRGTRRRGRRARAGRSRGRRTHCRAPRSTSLRTNRSKPTAPCAPYPTSS